MTHSPQVPGNSELVARLRSLLLDYDADLEVTIAAGILPDREAYGEDVSGVTYALLSSAADALSTAEARIEALEAERANLIVTKREQIERLTAERDALSSIVTTAIDDVAGAELDDLEARAETAEATIASLRGEVEWQPIETAPKDGTEVIGYRPDQGAFCFRWAWMSEFVATDRNGDPIEDYDEMAADWWHDRWGWMEGDLRPTHWRHLPAPPAIRNLKEAGNG